MFRFQKRKKKNTKRRKETKNKRNKSNIPVTWAGPPILPANRDCHDRVVRGIIQCFPLGPIKKEKSFDYILLSSN
jgi:hypothetical protein